MLIDSKIMKIKCDQCGMEMHEEFTYYSFDVRKINIFNNIRPEVYQILDEPILYSKDICSLCANDVFNRVITINGKEIRKTRSIRPYDVCEITGEHMVGSYFYYYVTVDKVDVNVRLKSINASKRLLEFKCKPADQTKLPWLM